MKKAIFLLKYDLNWLGGIYYKIHLIRALRSINPAIQIIIYTESVAISSVEALVEGFDVHVKCYDRYIPRGFGRIEHALRKRLDFSLFGLFDIDLIMNNKVFDFDSKGILRVVPLSRRIYWIPDLQDLYLPDLFSKSTLALKKKRYEHLAKTAKMLVFSSQDSFESFNKYYSASVRKSLKVILLKFTVFHPVLPYNSLPALLSKFGLESKPFFIVSNQFMAHKNHILVIEAMNKLKTITSLPFKMIFTGKTEDPRNPQYFSSLTKKIQDCNLIQDIVITGVIEREEQLLLLKSALAVIQPSKFEGWNSTVEDAKLLKANIISSDIGVHREQLEEYPAKFIDPNDPEQLADLLIEIQSEGWKYGQSNMDYGKYQRDFAKSVEQLFLQ